MNDFPGSGEPMSRVSELTLENFQGVSNRQTVQLGAFTLIYGENSAGKSSIARSLLLVGQSLSEALYIKGDSRNRFFIYSGQQIDLAGFKNVIHKHEEDRSLKIGLKVLLDNQDRLVLPPITRSTVKARPQISSVELVAVAFEVTESSAGLEEFVISFDFSVAQIVETMTLSFQSGEKGDLSLVEQRETSREATKAFLGVADSEDFAISDLHSLEYTWMSNWPAIRGARGIESGEVAKTSLARTLDMWLRSAKMHFLSLIANPHHIPSLREIEPRVTVRSTQPLRSTKLRRIVKNRDAASSQFLSQLTQGRYEIESSSYEMGESGFLGEVEVKFLRDKHLGVAVSFQDVGVGLSQVLPLLSAINTLRISPGEQLIIAEQPELHLHPKMQAELAELMFRESQSNGQIIAETHSEPILLRLQRIVRELDRDGQSYRSVAVIYASFDPELGTRFENLELRRDLDFIVLLPTSFSDLRMEEL